MDTPLKSRPAPGPIPTLEARHRTAILGSATIPGRAEEVSGARSFIARTLAATGKGQRVDSDAATLLTSELVTNAIQHTASGTGDGSGGGGLARGSVVVLTAPAAVRDQVDLWGPVPSLGLMRAVKRQFDPGNLMAPGRGPGGI